MGGLKNATRLDPDAIQVTGVWAFAGKDTVIVHIKLPLPPEQSVLALIRVGLSANAAGTGVAVGLGVGEGVGVGLGGRGGMDLGIGLGVGVGASVGVAVGTAARVAVGLMLTVAVFDERAEGKIKASSVTIAATQAKATSHESHFRLEPVLWPLFPTNPPARKGRVPPVV